MAYNEEDFLMLSGIEHFYFCSRQWALIHIEHLWAENFWTVDGSIMHERAHDKEFVESRGDLLVTRGMQVMSREMGVTGACDVVEFHRRNAQCLVDGDRTAHTYRYAIPLFLFLKCKYLPKAPHIDPFFTCQSGVFIPVFYAFDGLLRPVPQTGTSVITAVI